MNELPVSSWDELNGRLFEDSWKEDLHRFRSDFAFRGLPDASFDLRSSLLRLNGCAEIVEGHLLRNFRKYAARDAVPDRSIWSWLAIAQHHGLPTRLVDWTYSPYVALHFVTADLDSFDVDGVIWCVNYACTNQYLPDVLKAILEAEGANTFTVEMLNCAASTLAEFRQLARTEFVAFFEPPSLDARIVNQFALFSLMASARARLDTWLYDHPDAFRRVVIPASLKWEVRDKLDQANVSERVLFPGPDGLSQYLKRYYTPRKVEPLSATELRPGPSRGQESPRTIRSARSKETPR